jgi:hypothetical protein
MSAVGHTSRLQRAVAWLAVILAVALLAFGIFRHGFSLEVRERFWTDIFGRVSGPMTFRLFLQPVMGFVAAVPDGLRDAREGHSSFFWTSYGDTSLRHGRLRQGLIATARILLLGLSMDLIYQMKVFHQFYPAEAVMFSIVLAVIPYFIWRWLVERIARWHMAQPRKSAMGSPDE